jgi:hypothetical protein
LDWSRWSGEGFRIYYQPASLIYRKDLWQLESSPLKTFYQTESYSIPEKML